MNFFQMQEEEIFEGTAKSFGHNYIPQRNFQRFTSMYSLNSQSLTTEAFA